RRARGRGPAGPGHGRPDRPRHVDGRADPAAPGRGRPVGGLHRRRARRGPADRAAGGPPPAQRLGRL
ncbi:MAG: hypothetical protein AVDCRST_MAG48-2283, partial [uncultured Friedmanniella sp.]